MLQLHENETVVMVVHKHWFVMAGTAVFFLVLIFIPPAVLTILPIATGGFDPTVVEPLTNFGLALYLMVFFLFLYLFWMDYYLDMWVVTTERIIDIEQRGLFSREISEVPLANVQDITIEVHGIVETFLKFGTIRIQTAGMREFVIANVPKLYELKDIILKQKSFHSHGGTQQVGANKT